MPDTKPKLFVAIVMDESGSMQDCKAATVSGFNEFIQEQKKNTEGIVLVTLTKFSTECNTVYTAQSVEEVPELNEDTYCPGGGTALYDAIGLSIKALEEDLARETITPGVVFVVITDGYNNSSNEYKAETIKSLIAEREKKGNWTFVFLGADIDAAAGKDIGFANTHSYAKSASSKTFQAMGLSTSNYANTKLYAGGPLKSEDFMAEAQDAWDKVSDASKPNPSNPQEFGQDLIAKRGIHMPDDSKPDDS